MALVSFLEMKSWCGKRWRKSWTLKGSLKRIRLRSFKINRLLCGFWKLSKKSPYRSTNNRRSTGDKSEVIYPKELKQANSNWHSTAVNSADKKMKNMIWCEETCRVTTNMDRTFGIWNLETHHTSLSLQITCSSAHWTKKISAAEITTMSFKTKNNLKIKKTVESESNISEN